MIQIYGVAFGPRYPFILHMALSVRPVSATTGFRKKAAQVYYK